MLVLAITDLRQAAAHRRRRGGDVGGGSARDRPGLRRRPAGAASPSRAGALGGEPRRDARRLRRGRLAPWPGLQPGAGRLLAALLAAGARRRPRHRRARGRRRRSGSSPRPSTTRSCSPRTDGWSPTATSTERRSGTSLDFLAIVAADVASISERRTDRFLDKARNHGLPPFLAGDPGVDSGHMIAQYTQAAIVSELKRLAVPASVDSIPSSAMQEDHVSMGWSAARKLRRSVDGLHPGGRHRAAHRGPGARPAGAARALAGDRRGRPAAARRRASRGPGPTATSRPEIETAVELVRSGAVRDAVEDVIGELQ